MKAIEDYNEQATRDLVWALTSPSLIAHELSVADDWGRLDVARHQGLLGRLDDPTSSLGLATRRMRGNRLGDYFELLIISWMKELPEVHVIGSNIQVHGGQGTIGEFDLLFERDRTFWHWELAIKYYLAFADSTGETFWYGPNPKDRLDLKWSKMRDRQLQLGKRRRALSTLRKYNVRYSPEPRAFVKGYLFEPLSEMEVDEHPDASPACLRGWWVHRRFASVHRAQLETDGRLDWVELPRLEWMSPALDDGAASTYDFENLLGSLRPSRSALVAGLDPETGLEVTRGFIVPDDWPDL